MIKASTFNKDFFSFQMLQRFFLLLALILFSVPALAFDNSKQYVSIDLVADQTQIEGGDTVTIGVIETIHPGWHVYWINPGDSGEPTRIQWSGVDNIQNTEFLWPAPHKLPIGPLTNYGYEDELILLQDLTFPEDLPQGPITLTADISLLVCEEICIPESHQATITFNGEETANPGLIEDAKNNLPQNVDWPASYNKNGDAIEFKITVEDTSRFQNIGSVHVFPYEPGLIANAAIPKAEFMNTGLRITQDAGEVSAEGIKKTDIVITYENESGQIQSVRLEASLDNASKGATVAPPAPNVENGAAEIGFFVAILLAIAGGLILNLMPCVFPVLSLKALSLLNCQKHEEKEVRIHGLAYTAGVILSFLAIAAVLIALKSGGEQIGWGFQLQNPIVVTVLAYLLFLVGLNLAGFFEFGTGFMSIGSKLTQKDGASGSFFTGVLATAVATPCTAPFMASAMGYALTQPAIISLAVFTALGFGLALPFLLLTFVPATRNMLPKPGAWMETFKEFLAFPMFGFAVWLIWVLSQQAGSMGVLLALLGLVALSFALWLGKKGSKVLAVIFFIIGLLPIILVRPAPSAEMMEVAAQKNWISFSEDLLAEKLEGDDPVFVEMTAAWCITCKVNERVALTVPQTKMLFKERGVQYLKGDWTNRNETITKYLERYGRNGVPIYVYYGPRNTQNGQRPEAVVLPQLLTPAIVRTHIEE